MDDRTALRAAGGLSLAAALVHGALAPEHFDEWWGYGAFFTLAAVAQMGWGIIAFHRSLPGAELRLPDLRLFLLAGIAGNVLLVVVYVVSRTTGVPFFGPEAGEPEAWSALGVLTKLFEVGIVALSVRLVRSP